MFGVGGFVRVMWVGGSLWGVVVGLRCGVGFWGWGGWVSGLVGVVGVGCGGVVFVFGMVFVVLVWNLVLGCWGGVGGWLGGVGVGWCCWGCRGSWGYVGCGCDLV